MGRSRGVEDEGLYRDQHRPQRDPTGQVGDGAVHAEGRVDAEPDRQRGGGVGEASVAARRLVDAGTVEITQKGRVVDPSAAKGPIRIRRAR